MPHASRPTRHEHGVALVITVVLLTVIMFMTVTFLVVSHSQHGSVATETDQAVARLAADSARERAIIELITPIMASANEFNYGLRVSTNFINPGGFVSGLNSPTNVSYNYLNGNPLNLNDSLQNLANLLYDPRPPVFIATNSLAVKSNEFRFFLDLNRNGIYDPSGLQPVVGLNGEWYKPNGIVLSNSVIGDPEWIGGLRRPEFAHSADNPFIYRYAYLVVPAGQTLDLNCIHNDAKRLDLNKSNDGFLRNQGVLTAEINLAAFLADLNTNYWPTYQYIPFTPPQNPTQNPSPLSNIGVAFEDASALLRYRYNGNLNTLASVSALFPGNGVNAFKGDFIDGYSAGPVMLGTWWPAGSLTDSDSLRVGNSWSGADTPNRFYTTQDLFDRTKTTLPATGKPLSFTDRLLAAGAQTNSYDRYTFYRLLSQLGTDSAPEPGGKMNVNYCNVDANGYVVPNMATNFTPWQPTNFFINAAIRLLADAGYTVGDWRSTSNLLVLGSNNVNGVFVFTTNLHIPIWPANFYTPSVHRLLQFAANMYDATTNRNFNVATAANGFPTVFRPMFSAGPAGGQPGVSIIGYREVATTTDTDDLISNANAATPPLDISNPTIPPGKITDKTMIYGIPLVIGAKKGLPNFNEFAMHSQVQVTRKLQFHRPGTSTTDKVNEIDQMFVVGISNVLGVEAWNSYAANYPRGIEFRAWPDITVLVTNLENNTLLRVSSYQPSAIITNISAYQWAGYDPRYSQYSLQVPLFTNYVFLSNMTYRVGPPGQFMPLTGVFERMPGGTNFHLPHWKLKMKTRLRFALVDTSVSPRRIVDYVNLAADTDLDITDALTTGGACGDTYTPDGSNGGMWCTNRMYGSTLDSTATYGIQNQIEASKGGIAVDWNSSPQEALAGMSVFDAQAFFKGQFAPSYLRSSNTFNAPFQPVRNLYLVTSWQANDPLVHYTVGDLVDLVHTNLMVDNLLPSPTANLRQVNGRYEPWGGNPSGGSASQTKTDLTVKDPLMIRSDNWDFPTNKFPNVGWLGRVHRGTPWQTVFLKSFSVPNYTNWFQNWQKWTGNGQIVANLGQISPNLVATNYLANDAFFTQPTNDWHLLDLFTTALNDNATRGQLSVNQTNLAAWSAVFSGVLVLTNTPDGFLLPLVIQPAGYYDPSDSTTWPPLVRLFNGINVARSNSSPRHVFGRLSDFLAVPELTMASPFLNTNIPPSLGSSGLNIAYALNDAAYERLPQQIAGLLKADPVPRFVIYSYGQTLKPESTRAIVKSGAFAGLCTNYQVVAEAATRTVVRLEGVQPNHGANPITTLHPIIESINVLPPD